VEGTTLDDGSQKKREQTSDGNKLDPLHRWRYRLASIASNHLKINPEENTLEGRSGTEDD